MRWLLCSLSWIRFGSSKDKWFREGLGVGPFLFLLLRLRWYCCCCCLLFCFVFRFEMLLIAVGIWICWISFLIWYFWIVIRIIYAMLWLISDNFVKDFSLLLLFLFHERWYYSTTLLLPLSKWQTRTRWMIIINFEIIFLCWPFCVFLISTDERIPYVVRIDLGGSRYEMEIWKLFRRKISIAHCYYDIVHEKRV